MLDSINVRKKKPKQNFSEAWLKDVRFQFWTLIYLFLRKVLHVSSFFCVFCNISVVDSLSQIYRHAESKNHIIKCKENETNKSNEEMNYFCHLKSEKNQQKFAYAALIADKNILHQSAKDIPTFFQKIGKDYNVLKDMNMDRTKYTNIISNVLCQIETDRVVESIQNTKFSIFINETSDILNEKWMTFFVHAEKLFNAFKIEMWKLNIPFVNIVALSCDNASVMVGKHLSFKKKLEEFCKNLITLPFATFINSPNINSPKRSAIYQKFYEYIIKLFLTKIIISEKTKSGTYLLSMMQNLDIKAYFLFLQIYLLQPKSVEFSTTVYKYFLKSEHLNNLCCNIKYDENENQKSLEEVFLGFECEEYLNELLKKGHAEIVTNIRKNCLQFYVTVAEEIRKRLPINDKFLLKLKVIECNLALLNIDRETLFNDVSFIAENFGGFDENGLKKEWLTLQLDFTIIEKEELLKLSFDDMWKQILQNQYSTNSDKYPNLKRLLNAVRSLSNLNADPERMFSILTDVKTKKRNKFSSSINAICVLKSALKTKKETILDMEIDEKHLSLMLSDILYNNSKRQKSNLKCNEAYNYNITDPSTSDMQ
ncbi:hypothetical protein ACFW04_011775 [Cataglyphis niger]